MKKPPLILISSASQQHGEEFEDSSVSLSHCYPRAIQAAGGIPWVLPVTVPPEAAYECVSRCDGVMLSGGDDIQPKIYQDEIQPFLAETVGPTNPERDALEIALVEAVFQLKKPLFAICRGHQLLNVAMGGNMIIDIQREKPESIKHQCMDQKDKPVHALRLLPNSLLHQIMNKDTIEVNSTHHQAVGRLAKLFTASAVSSDQIIEGIELSSEHTDLLPCLLSVQFHPERLFEKHPEFFRLFRYFIIASEKQ